MSESDTVITVTDASFTEIVLRSPEPVLVDFWAPWCERCKKLSPALDEVASEHGGKITVAKLDVDANPESAKNFHVMSLPTLVVFRDGQPVRSIIGVKAKSELLDELDAILLRSSDEE